jgi:two-component system, OmpR family, response regulator
LRTDVRILLVEDDRVLADYLTERLLVSGHGVESVVSAEEALDRIGAVEPEVVIVDRMLPGMDGLKFIRLLRDRGFGVPVIVTSALDQHDDRILGLNAGADDYIGKPVHSGELLARIDAVARRATAGALHAKLTSGALSLDLISREASIGDRRIDLTPREFRLLECLMRSAPQPVTRRMLLEQVWGYNFDPQTNVIDVHISRLRHAIGDGEGAPVLMTVRGVGYVLKPH